MFLQHSADSVVSQGFVFISSQSVKKSIAAGMLWSESLGQSGGGEQQGCCVPAAALPQVHAGTRRTGRRRFLGRILESSADFPFFSSCLFPFKK